MSDLLDKINELRDLWRLLMPQLPPPDDKTFGIWNLNHDDEIVRHAFGRAAAKFRQGTDDPQNAYRYASGVMRSEQERRVNGQQGNQ